MIELSAGGRGGAPDEVGAVGTLLMGPDGGFITGSDFLMDGGCNAAHTDLSVKWVLQGVGGRSWPAAA